MHATRYASKLARPLPRLCPDEVRDVQSSDLLARHEPAPSFKNLGRVRSPRYPSHVFITSAISTFTLVTFFTFKAFLENIHLDYEQIVMSNFLFRIDSNSEA